MMSGLSRFVFFTRRVDHRVACCSRYVYGRPKGLCSYSTAASHKNTRASNTEISCNDHQISFKETTFENVFLRDACSCRDCVDSSTQQRRFSTGQIPLDIRPKSVARKENEEYEITWTAKEGCDHVSVYSQKRLEQLASSACRYNSRWRFARDTVLWDAATLQENFVSRSYDEYMNEEEAFSDIVLGLYSTGLAFLRNAPTKARTADSEVVVEKVARKIGYIKETFYGTSWDVVSLPDAKNIAYTSENLPLHMDLLYYESPPGVQLLHCITNRADGGESVYVDSFHAAYQLLDDDPTSFYHLTMFPVTFHYRNDGYHYVYTRPVIELDYFYSSPTPEHPPVRIKCVNYSPPFQAPFEHFVTQAETVEGRLDFREFIRAFNKFEKMIHTTSHQFETKFQPGDVALFMNRRVLHSRRGFKLSSSTESHENDGNYGRWLKGTYLDIDSFYSKLRELSGL
ncbi:taurine catabolism dioxygenase TauD, TfdA family-domain-containing protein [Lipomyces kononenkoae]|uniref:Taurine catabolism dioxygenase TauD, TfdA family-domain-containing protein n=1 Tax=Lipomyces kononenkoae TaxID=34357 RepID=A0ACC3T4Q4_LIPKO